MQENPALACLRFPIRRAPSSGLGRVGQRRRPRACATAQLRRLAKTLPPSAHSSSSPTAGRTDPDATPVARSTSIRLGDQFRLQAHVVRCGDSTDPAHVDALLGGATPHLMPTDPPYGVNYAADCSVSTIERPHEGSAH